MRIGLVVGHTPGKDRGAYSEALQSTEFDYWLPIVRAVSDELSDSGVFCIVAIHDEKLGYYDRQKKMANHLNPMSLDLVIEFHFNAASPLANGTETLYWFGSEKGKRIAGFMSYWISLRKETKMRGDHGAKALVNKNDRGYWFTYLQKSPAVIFEPFFGSNPKEASKFKDAEHTANMIAQMIINIKEQL